MRRLLDFDDFSGVSTWYERSDDGKSFTIARTQDVGPILEANKRQALSGKTKLGKKGTVEMHLHARIPVVWRESFIKKYGKDIVDKSVRKEFFLELEKPENRYLKTTWKRHRVRA